jgi:hypothetical protein
LQEYHKIRQDRFLSRPLLSSYPWTPYKTRAGVDESAYVTADGF